jgi:hypothetical protein
MGRIDYVDDPNAPAANSGPAAPRTGTRIRPRTHTLPAADCVDCSSPAHAAALPGPTGRPHVTGGPVTAVLLMIAFLLTAAGVVDAGLRIAPVRPGRRCETSSSAAMRKVRLIAACPLQRKRCIDRLNPHRCVVIRRCCPRSMAQLWLGPRKRARAQLSSATAACRLLRRIPLWCLVRRQVRPYRFVLRTGRHRRTQTERPPA